MFRRFCDAIGCESPFDRVMVGFVVAISPFIALAIMLACTVLSMAAFQLVVWIVQ
jgi:hypothetical protein